VSPATDIQRQRPRSGSGENPTIKPTRKQSPLSSSPLSATLNLGSSQLSSLRSSSKSITRDRLSRQPVRKQSQVRDTDSADECPTDDSVTATALEAEVESRTDVVVSVDVSSDVIREVDDDEPPGSLPATGAAVGSARTPKKALTCIRPYVSDCESMSGILFAFVCVSADDFNRSPTRWCARPKQPAVEAASVYLSRRVSAIQSN